MNRLIAGVAAAGLAAGLYIPRAAEAERTQECDPLLQDLWEGVNDATGESVPCGEVFGNDAEPVDDPEAAEVIAPVYVALGDSVAAGLGLPPRGTDSGIQARCERSSQAYPELVAHELGISAINLACRGATAGDLITEQHPGGTFEDLEPQITEAFTHGTPEFMTITAGANDMDWDGLLRRCYAYDCGNWLDEADVTVRLEKTKAMLRLAMEAVRLLSDGTEPDVYMTGYYVPLSEACSRLSPDIMAEEIVWGRDVVGRLNASIAEVADEYDFAEFVDVDFAGHELCDPEPWVQGIADAAPGHPLPNGQAEYARAVIAARQD
jgi:lysophospholipase L1-like esterase